MDDAGPGNVDTVMCVTDVLEQTRRRRRSSAPPTLPSFTMPSFKPNQPLDTTPSSSPESSPPSSPAFGPVDSSPPSSPSIGPLSTPPESPGPLDPYAGSNKSSQRPRQYDAQKRVKPLGFGSLPKRVADAHDPFNDASPGPSRTSHLYQPVNIFHPYSEHDRPPRDTSVPRAPHVDPYAASAHKDWTPPRREKKPLARSSSATSAFEPKPPNEPNPSIIVVRPPSHSPDGDVLDAEDEEHPLGISLTDTEEQIWDKVFNGAVDKLDIDINLAYVPASLIAPAFRELNGCLLVVHTGIHPC